MLKVVDINKKASEIEVKELKSLSQVVKGLKDKFPGLVHWRVPICNSAAPLESDFDIICKTLVGTGINTPVIVNDQVGLSRATTGCVVACLFKEFQISASFEGLIETVPGVNLAILKTDNYKMDPEKDTLFRGEFDVVKELVEKMSGGAAAKNECDKVIDKNGTPKTGGTGIKQLRENIAESKLSYEIMDDAAQAFLKMKIMDNIHKYFYLIVFTGYIRQAADLARESVSDEQKAALTLSGGRCAIPGDQLKLAKTFVAYCDGTLDSEEKVLEAVMLIFKNAKEFNEEGSEWFDNASNVEHHFNELLENLDVERKLTEVDENGKLKFAEIPPHYLKKIAEKGGEKYAADVNHETLLKFAEDAVEKLGKDKEDFDAKELVLSIHRVFFEEAQALARDPSSKNNAFYVALALNHELRQIHHDRDVINHDQTDKARVILLEFRKDITSGKLDDIKSNWLKVMKSGPGKGIETKDVYGEDGEFESLMDKLVVASNEFYKKEKRFATTEELIATNKKLRGNKDLLEKRLKEKVEENRQFRKLLDDISRLSDYRKQLKKGA